MFSLLYLHYDFVYFIAVHVFLYIFLHFIVFYIIYVHHCTVYTGNSGIVARVHASHAEGI